MLTVRETAQQLLPLSNSQITEHSVPLFGSTVLGDKLVDISTDAVR